MSSESVLSLQGRFSPVPSYVLAAGSLALGVHCFVNPRGEAARFGLLVPENEDGTTPQDQQRRRQQQQQQKHVGESLLLPLVCLKGTREVSYGLLLAGLEYVGGAGGSGGVTVLAAVLSLNGLVDGLVVWRYGLRDKAFGHGFAGVALAAWAWWRTAAIRRA